MFHKIIKIFPCLATGLFALLFSVSCGLSPKKTDPWPKTGLGSMLPEPPGIIDIHWDHDDSFYAYAEETSADDYRQYLELCVESGFAQEAHKDSNGYEAFNSEGYKLELTQLSDSFSITIEAPIRLGTFSWPSGTAGNIVPEIHSDIGKIEYDHDDSFSLYAGNITKESFNAYVDECIEAGYSLSYRRDDDYYQAKNAEGYTLKVQYEGFGVVQIILSEPVPDPTDFPDGEPTATQAVGSLPTPTDKPVLNEDPSFDIGEAYISTRTDILGISYLSVSIPVNNTGNTDLYLSSGSIDIEYSNGSLAQTLNLVNVYPQIIKANETAYYYDEVIFEGTETDGLKVVPHFDISKSKVEYIRLPTSDVQIKDTNYLGVKVIGRVENDTSKEQKLVYVVILLFDDKNNCIGQLIDIINSIPPKERIGFEATSLNGDISASDVSKFIVYAYPYQVQW